MNNPVMFSDSTGCSPVPTLRKFASILGKGLIYGGKALLSLSSANFAAAASMLEFIKFADGGAVVNPTWSSIFNKATNQQYWGKIFKGFGTGAKVIGYGLLALEAGIKVYDNFNNPNLSFDRKITDSIVDVASTFGGVILGAKIGAVIGTFIPIPVVGTLIGAAIGAGIAYGVSWVMDKYGTYIKEGFNNFIMVQIPSVANTVGDFFSNAWNDFWNWAT